MIPIVDTEDDELTKKKQKTTQDLIQLQTPKEEKETFESELINSTVDEEVSLALSSTPKNKTKELLQLARQSASQKLATFLPASPASTIVKQKVLKGPESPAFSLSVKKCQLLQEQEQPNVQEPSSSSSLKLFSNHCVECGLKMTLLKPFTCSRCRASFCPEHAPRSFSGVSFESVIDGRWQRVCETCHVVESGKKRPVKPTCRSLFGFFSQVRAEFHDFKEIEATRLQRRLEKLADFNAAASKQSFSTFERQIVPWQADESSHSCPFCLQSFTRLQRRKHHCRLCGRLACQDCLASKEVPLRLADGQVQNIKNCRTCHSLLFRPKLEPLIPSLLKLNELYRTASALEIQILETIPMFNELLLRSNRSPQQVHDIWALRDTLILVSLHFKSTLCELADLAESESQPRWRIFAANVRRAGNLFIQRHMFTLQILEEAKDSEVIKPALVFEVKPDSSPVYKKFIPEALIEAFTLTTEHDNASQVSLGLYEQDGQPILQANREALDLKRSVLTEQLEQMRQALKEEDSVDAKIALQESIDHLSGELRKLSRIKL